MNMPGPQFGLNELIDAYTHQIIEQKSKNNTYNPLRPSAAGKCERELGFEFMEFRGYAKYEQELRPPNVHRLLSLGDKIEWHAIDEMYNAFKLSSKPIQIKYKQQTLSFFRLHDDTLIEGKIDLWIEGDNWRCIADWKSKGDKYSQFYKSSWDEFIEKLVKTGHATQFGADAVYITDLEKFLETTDDVFFANNLYQLNFYGCSDFAKERKLQFCSILQYNKSDSRIREVRFVPSEAVFEKTKQKFLKVAQIVDTEKSVENLNRDYVLGSTKCAFCSFKKECYPENDALKEFFGTLPKKQWPKDIDRLPSELQQELVPLFEQYHALANAPDELEKIEQKIVGELYKHKVFKIRLKEDQIYLVKRLKEGLVLRRSKL